MTVEMKNQAQINFLKMVVFFRGVLEYAAKEQGRVKAEKMAASVEARALARTNLSRKR